MAITNFIPEVFANEVLLALPKVASGLTLCNRNYEGLIQKKGDTVHIATPSALTVNAYTGADITFETPSDSKTDLVIDKADYIAAIIDATKQSVSPYDLANIYLEEGKVALSDSADKYIYNIMANGADASNTIDTVVLSASNIVTKIEEARKLLSKNNILPSADTFITLSPDEVSLLRRSSDFIKATDLSDSVLLTGQVGKLFGFRIIESNNLFTQDPATITTGNPVHKLIPFGVVGATTFANAIPYDQVIVGEPEKKFGAYIKALHFYGAKVIRPKAIGIIKADTGVDGTM